ncbi:hypothetical protein [Scytonema sp. NUACC26]|uniref:hypothetical protein n=1 Tax=Scytonema sp. NUACC26 TaxID=3140176 RepID=UPI0034DC8A0B
MKVIQETPNNLTLQLRPWFTWIFSTTFILAGLSIAVFGGQVHTLKCRRILSNPSVCEVSSAGLLWSTQQNIPVSDIQGTEVDVIQDNKKNVYYQIVIVTNQKRVPILIKISDYETIEMWTKQIEVFLTKTQIQELLVQKDERLEGFIFGAIFGGIFILIGVITLGLFGTAITCTIDKKLGKLTIRNRGLLTYDYAEYEIQDILRVVVEKYHGNQVRTTYRVVLVTGYRERVPFTSDFSLKLKQQQQTANQISSFLGLKTTHKLEIFPHPDTKYQSY